MIIVVPDEEIKQMVEKMTTEATRKRIKEMQGDYTSKGFIEGIIHDVIWQKISVLCPDIELYVRAEIKKCIEVLGVDNAKMTKKQIVELVVSELLDRLCEQY